jgi:Putative metallopeptidase
MMQDFHFKPGIKLSAEECGEPNAYWDPDERKLTICYEIVSDYRKMV